VVSFYPFDQDDFLRIVAVWLEHFKSPGPRSAEVQRAALQWAMQRGSRSGRVAWQFARDWAGKERMKAEGGRRK
jgi:predicted AAA+ superfamily ATPase